MSTYLARGFLPLLGSIGCLALVACASSASRDVEDQSATEENPGTEEGTKEPAKPPVSVVSDDGGAPTAACKGDPGNYDIPGDNCDNDGDGKIDNVVNCDAALAITGSAGEFAKSLGLCKSATGTSDWGVVSARYTNSYQGTAEPDAEHHGILKKFGGTLTPTEGASLGVLSTGYAREYNTSGTSTSSFRGGGSIFPSKKSIPKGYPKAAQGCTIATDAYDVVTAKIEIRVPKNAKGFKFDFNFYTSEWPQFVCTEWNDGFLAFLTSSEFNNGAPENISFDAKANPVSVNNGFFDRCTPNTKTCGAKPTVSACSGGETELAGTGFFNKGTYCSGTTTTAGGATGWLTTQAPVKPSETITLEYMIWNTGDDAYQSSVLVDNFRWEPAALVVQTERPN